MCVYVCMYVYICLSVCTCAFVFVGVHEWVFGVRVVPRRTYIIDVHVTHETGIKPLSCC